jgi:hypothetical protein
MTISSYKPTLLLLYICCPSSTATTAYATRTPTSRACPQNPKPLTLSSVYCNNGVCHGVRQLPVRPLPVPFVDKTFHIASLLLGILRRYCCAYAALRPQHQCCPPPRVRQFLVHALPVGVRHSQRHTGHYHTLHDTSDLNPTP